MDSHQHQPSNLEEEELHAEQIMQQQSNTMTLGNTEMAVNGLYNNMDIYSFQNASGNPLGINSITSSTQPNLRNDVNLKNIGNVQYQTHEVQQNRKNVPNSQVMPKSHKNDADLFQNYKIKKQHINEQEDTYSESISTNVNNPSQACKYNSQYTNGLNSEAIGSFEDKTTLIPTPNSKNLEGKQLINFLQQRSKEDSTALFIEDSNSIINLKMNGVNHGAPNYRKLIQSRSSGDFSRKVSTNSQIGITQNQNNPVCVNTSNEKSYGQLCSITQEFNQNSGSKVTNNDKYFNSSSKETFGFEGGSSAMTDYRQKEGDDSTQYDVFIDDKSHHLNADHKKRRKPIGKLMEESKHKIVNNMTNNFIADSGEDRRSNNCKNRNNIEKSPRIKLKSSLTSKETVNTSNDEKLRVSVFLLKNLAVNNS